MDMKFTEAEIQEIENQLSCPSGSNGVEMGQNVNQTNLSMIHDTIEQLELQSHQRVLELGPGNGVHLEKILQSAQHLSYQGLEISTTMLEEAQRINKNFLIDQQAQFQLYDGQHLPFPDQSFDRILTVNTLYFWQKPAELLQEIYRVLQPGGIAIITYAQKDFMEKLPFVRDKFRKYNNQDVNELIHAIGQSPATFIDRVEQVKSKTGELVDRAYSMAKLIK